MNVMTMARAERAITQRELARRTGLALTSINEIETGKRRARALSAVKIAKVLGIDPNDVIRAKAD